MSELPLALPHPRQAGLEQPQNTPKFLCLQDVSIGFHVSLNKSHTVESEQAKRPRVQRN